MSARAPIRGWARRGCTCTSLPPGGGRTPGVLVCLREGETKLSLDFKWADGITRPGEVLDLYASGDAAPEGRFRYRYEAD